MDYQPEAGRFKNARDVVENLNSGLKKELFSYDFTDAKIQKSLDETRGKVAQDVYFSNGTWKKAKEQRLLTIEPSAAEFSEVMRRAARTVGKEFAPGGEIRRRGKKVARKLQEHLDRIADILIEKVRPQSGGVSPAKLLAAKTLYDELFTTLFDNIREQRKQRTPPDEYVVINISKWDNTRWLECVMNAEDDPSTSRPERTQHQRQEYHPYARPDSHASYTRGYGHSSFRGGENQRQPRESTVNKRCNVCGNGMCIGKDTSKNCPTGGNYLRKQHTRSGLWMPDEKGVRVCWAFNSNAGCSRRDCPFEHRCSLDGRKDCGGAQSAAHSS
ncbi:hypothetical protein CYLTODRAFT_422095 [Cylindrobasidium torrendii FP15055 ss-10]|uniref:Uncharacterized protein n=1 Tax=Cylindrobasidium torrendii FP15055 ss-10 TaxID=1314674 RepID=A0A0D7BCI7_9AGAR|nr:hypothetical protein CYLTODRAFT_422095 [Cylindrobasidium torrendii FP15055 ss-10]